MNAVIWKKLNGKPAKTHARAGDKSAVTLCGKTVPLAWLLRSTKQPGPHDDKCKRCYEGEA